MQFVLKNILIKKVKISLFENKISSFRGVAQLVARVVWDHQAAGSNPVTPTNGSVLIGSPIFYFPQIL